MIDDLNVLAATHEAEGGTCKTITIHGKEIKCCLDENGDIKSYFFKVLAAITGQ